MYGSKVSVEKVMPMATCTSASSPTPACGPPVLLSHLLYMKIRAPLQTQSVTDHDWGSVLGDFECAHDCNRGVDTTAECSCVMSHVRRLMNSSQHKHNESLGTTVIPPDFAVDVWNVTGLLSALDYAGSGMYQDFDKGNLTLTDDGSILKGLSTGEVEPAVRLSSTRLLAGAAG